MDTKNNDGTNMDTKDKVSETSAPQQTTPKCRISVTIRNGNKNKFLKRTLKNYKNNFLIVIGKFDAKKSYNPIFGNVYYALNEKEANELADFMLAHPEIYYSAPDPIDRALSIDHMTDDELIQYGIYEEINNLENIESDEEIEENK